MGRAIFRRLASTIWQWPLALALALVCFTGPVIAALIWPNSGVIGPLSLVGLVFGIGATIVLAYSDLHDWKAEWRRARGLCPECGYDLRGSKDQCPECGEPIPSQSRPARQAVITASPTVGEYNSTVGQDRRHGRAKIVGMRHRLFNWMTLLSLLLGIAVAATWGPSLWWNSWVHVGPLAVGTDAGAVLLGCVPSVSHEPFFNCKRSDPPYNLSIPMVYVEWPGVTVVLPNWLLIPLCSVLPVWWAVRRSAARRRLRLGLCVRCGHDLRASKDQCPECGEPIPEAKPPATEAKA